MIEADDFIQPARALGFAIWAGVPCSFLTPFINRVIDDPAMQYISSANEGDAVATASGAALGGRPAVAMMQNSGLGNAISPLSSLNWVFRIPILLIITLRGEPGLADEPQHELMGQVTADLLDTLQVAWGWFPTRSGDVEPALAEACRHMHQTARPYAFIMRKGSVAPVKLASRWQGPRAPWVYDGEMLAPEQARLSRNEALRRVVDHTDEDRDVLIGTTGYTGRELFAIADRPNHLYMVGSMGCASSFGLGLSLAVPERNVFVLDGDGAALMRMGNFATVGAYGGANFRHLLLDNGVHESTGAQATVSGSVSFAAIASACAYAAAAESVDGADIISLVQSDAGPSLLHMRIRTGVPPGLPRPDVSPAEAGRRLMRQLGVATPWSG